MKTVYIIESFYLKRLSNGIVNSAVAIAADLDLAQQMKDHIEKRKDVECVRIVEHYLIENYPFDQ
jgi:hypothetical protein